MAREGFRRQDAAERRGGFLPARSRIAARSGVTLVELMISMLILAIVCIAWLQIIGIQSARKEARRREAVERLAGIMDAFMYEKRGASSIATGSYSVEMRLDGLSIYSTKDADTNTVHLVFADGVSPIGYQLLVCSRKSDANLRRCAGWDPPPRGAEPSWLVGKLYDRNGSLSEAGKPFFTLPVCLGL